MFVVFVEFTFEKCDFKVIYFEEKSTYFKVLLLSASFYFFYFFRRVIVRTIPKPGLALGNTLAER